MEGQMPKAGVCGAQRGEKEKGDSETALHLVLYHDRLDRRTFRRLRGRFLGRASHVGADDR